MQPYHAYCKRAVDVLLAAFKVRGCRRSELRAGIALALSFDTWRTLVREQGLAEQQAVDVVQRLCGEACAEPAANRGEARRARAAAK
jgi:hypothetical protein